MKLLTLLLIPIAAYGQVATPLTVYPGAGSASAQVRLREGRPNGDNWVALRAPSTLAADLTFYLPATDGAANQCLTTDGSGGLAFANCALDGGNTLGAALTLGTNDAYDLELKANGTTRLTVKAAGTVVVSNALNIGGNMSFSGTATPLFDGLGSFGTASYRYGGIYTYGLNAAGTITFPTGATNGYCWTSDASGNGSWQVCGGGAGLPVVDTTNIVKGSSDATKLLRFEVDGFTTATTRTLTPQNASYTIAGTDIAQTFTAAQQFNAAADFYGVSTFNNTVVMNSLIQGNVSPSAAITYSLGSSGGRWLKLWVQDTDVSGTGTIATLSVTGNAGIGGNLSFSGTATPLFDSLGSIGSSSYKYGSIYAWSHYAYTGYYMGGTQVIDSSRILLNIASVTGDWNPTFNNTYTLGSTSNYWNMIRTESIRTHGGNVSPATSLSGQLGSSGAVWNATYTNNLIISGTVTAPSGSSGQSVTVTVRDSAGTGTCTLIFSGGLKTGGTC